MLMDDKQITSRPPGMRGIAVSLLLAFAMRPRLHGV